LSVFILPDASVFNLVFPALIAVGFLATFGVECGVEFLEVFATAVALVLFFFGGFRVAVITAKKSVDTEGVVVFVIFVTAFGACDNLAIASTFVGLTDITVVTFVFFVRAIITAGATVFVYRNDEVFVCFETVSAKSAGISVIVAFPSEGTHFVSKFVGTIRAHRRLVVSLGETEDMNIFAEFNFTLGAFLDFVFFFFFFTSEFCLGDDGGDEFFVVFAFSFGEDCFNLYGGQTSILTGGCDFCSEFAGSLVVSVLVANGAGHSDKSEMCLLVCSE